MKVDFERKEGNAIEHTSTVKDEALSLQEAPLEQKKDSTDCNTCMAL